MSGRTPGAVTPYRPADRRRAGNVRNIVRPAAIPALEALVDALGEIEPPCVEAPEKWFPTRERDALDAIETCRTACHATRECLVFALASRERAGVWGGRYVGPSRTASREVAS